MTGRVQKILLASFALLVLAGCRTAPASASATTNAASSSDAGLPLPRATAKRLPDGVFYVLAGSDPSSYNLWQIDNSGDEIRLTHNVQAYGISAFGASAAGIVMADAASGFDELAQLTKKGPIFLKNGSGSGPEISSTGEITYEVSTYDKNGNVTGSKMLVRKTPSAPSRVIYQTKDDVSGEAWGPAGAIAFLTGSHYPGTKGPTPKVFVINKSGKVKNIVTNIGADLGSMIWNERNGGIGVSTWANNGEVIYGGSRHYRMPAGWTPAAWNPAGTELLAWGSNGKTIGLWSPAKPKSVRIIGALSSKVLVGEFAWLSKPAKL